MIGVARLAIPTLIVEIEGTAVASCDLAASGGAAG